MKKGKRPGTPPRTGAPPRRTDGQTDRLSCQIHPQPDGDTDVQMFCVLLFLLLLPGPLTPDPSPSLNVTFDPSTWRLHWACLAAPDARCRLLHPDLGPIEMGAQTWPGSPAQEGPLCYCQFGLLPLHRSPRFEVLMAEAEKTVIRGLNYANPGLPDSAATNLSCQVFEARALNCSWTPGPSAPPDTEYSLSLTFSRNHQAQACPGIPRDSMGPWVCHLAHLPNATTRIYVRIEGLSPMAPVRFYDAVFKTRDLERFEPPDNITVTCDPARCTIAWTRPQTWQNLKDPDFHYQLSLTRCDHHPGTPDLPIEVSGTFSNAYTLPSPEPRPRQVLRVRAGDVRVGSWGVWSRPLEFGSEVTPAPRLGQVVTPLLAGLGSLLCVLGLGWACGRLLHRAGLCGPVPRIRDKISDHAPHQVIWAVVLAPGQAEQEEPSPRPELSTQHSAP
ncbi:granulocyte-macrophage colony-stimulating factor receptor subunit alpha-like isoform X1 [Dipodomys merriami]|uniref:granulocyte-macrophage colony-stimulating factor receptor subunit alpha-like isoform X1 n=1 Tax=Dipodomys merriami TaxID=94247 RepID=UPI0038560CEA